VLCRPRQHSAVDLRTAIVSTLNAARCAPRRADVRGRRRDDRPQVGARPAGTLLPGAALSTAARPRAAGRAGLSEPRQEPRISGFSRVIYEAEREP